MWTFLNVEFCNSCLTSRQFSDPDWYCFECQEMLCQSCYVVKHDGTDESNPEKRINEPAHEIMVLFVLGKLIRQTRMRSHPVGLDV